MFEGHHGGDPFTEHLFGGGFRHHRHQNNKCNNNYSNGTKCSKNSAAVTEPAEKFSLSAV